MDRRGDDGAADAVSGLLADRDALAERRRLAGPGGPLAALADSLAADLELAVRADVHVATRKARLTRAGGRCPVHGTEFEFDPYAPDRFHCRACGRDHTGDAHHEFWLYRYQLWLAERAVHAAALHAVRGEAGHAAFAARILDEAADVYLRLPNRDNVLGPTRPFFSTYLESLWLLSLCVALDLLETAGADVGPLGDRVRDRLIAPSRALIASYPEGRSNRQVWNAAARLAASRLLGDAREIDRAVAGPDGVAATLRDGLLPDGTWYEGDNYHQFAHRGLWYGLAMAGRAGAAVDAELVERFARGFAAPFLVAMPGAVLPARRDAQFGVSLRQWRWAEWVELGLVRGPAASPDGAPTRGADDDGAARRALLAGWRRVLYDPDVRLPRETGRWRASGEAERNEPAAALTPADLGWKSLLFAAPPDDHALDGVDVDTDRADGRAVTRPPSVLLAAQGLAILRDPASDAYASLDFGPSGGGHGHPDRLNVQLPPQLVDPGTGTYVERTLHWYRSTLAHAAPLVDERSQPPVTGQLLGFDVADGVVQGVGAAAAIAPGVVVRRWLVLTRGYLVDRLAWTGLGDRVLDLPIGGALLAVGAADPGRQGSAAAGATGDPSTLRWTPVSRPGRGGLEDGFDFLTAVEETTLDPGGSALRLGAHGIGDVGHAAAWVTVHAPPGSALWRAAAPGAPGHAPGSICVVRARGDAGALTVVRALAGGRPSVVVDDDHACTVALDDVVDRHRPATDADGWQVDRARDGARPQRWQLAIGGPAASAAPGVPDGPAPAAARSADGAPIALVEGGAPLAFVLGAAHYRRSEASWAEAGRPTARVTVGVRGERLVVTVAVQLGRAPTFVPPGVDNPLDNERAAVNGDGVQLHLARVPGDGAAEVSPVGAWLLVPVVGATAVTVTPTLPGAGGAHEPTATWAAVPGGWTFAVELPLAAVGGRSGAAGDDVGAGPVVVLDLLVNEMPPERERRRGQLVLGGTEADGPGGAFVYLRGDRHDPARGLRLRLPAAP